MKCSQRLKKRLQFSVLYRHGVKIDTELFRIIYRKNHLSHSRFAAVVNRKFGPAVRRNKAKRVARSLFDGVQKKLSPACDLVFFPKSAMLTQRHAAIVRDFERVIEEADLFKGQP